MRPMSTNRRTSVRLPNSSTACGMSPRNAAPNNVPVAKLMNLGNSMVLTRLGKTRNNPLKMTAPILPNKLKNMIYPKSNCDSLPLLRYPF